jgi:membrane-associated phospholipid phosphatase
MSPDAWALQIAESARSPALTQSMRAITELGNPFALFFATFVATALLLHYRRLRDATALALGMSAVWLSTTALKEIIARTRPEDSLGVTDVITYSFPSGHAAGALVFYGFLAYLLVRDFRSKLDHRLTLCVAGILILAVGLSRIYLGVHYLSDVVGGYALGAAVLYLAVRITRR